MGTWLELVKDQDIQSIIGGRSQYGFWRQGSQRICEQKLFVMLSLEG